MKKIILVVLAACLAAPAAAQSRSIEFEEPDFGKALAKARETGRNLFVDCYTTWCGPCKRMDREVFTDDAVADYFNATFVNVRMDMEREGREPLKEYPVAGYPTFLILDAGGNLVHKMMGYYDPVNFLKAIQYASPGYSAEALKARFDGGDHSPETVEAYMFALKSGGDYKTMETTLRNVRLFSRAEDATDPAQWRIFSNFQSDLDSSDSRFFVANIDTFRRVYGDAAVDAKLDQLYTNKVSEYIYWKVRHPGVDFPEAEYDGFIEGLQTLEFDKSSISLALALTDRLFRRGKYAEAACLMNSVVELRVMNRRYESIYFTLFFDKLLDAGDAEALGIVVPTAEKLAADTAAAPALSAAIFKSKNE